MRRFLWARRRPNELERRFWENCISPMTLSSWQDAGPLIGSKAPTCSCKLAREVCQQRPRAFFVWVGGGPALELAQFEHDARLAGLGDRIRFTGAVTDAADYLAAADVFALTSRQDSYPLTALEAAALQKPIVCFAGAGGMPEFVEEDCGFVVPYLDATAMADRVFACSIRRSAVLQWERLHGARSRSATISAGRRLVSWKSSSGRSRETETVADGSNKRRG